MKLHFTKMHDAGNDFVVFDGIQTPIDFTPEQRVAIADRHFGVETDQFLLVERSTRPDVDFRYRVFDHDGGEVEHCDNDTRCFVKFVTDRGLTDKRTVRVEVMDGIATLAMQDDGQVTVNMGAPVFEAARLPFLPEGLPTRTQGDDTQHALQISGRTERLSTVPMGNPHAVQIVDDTEVFPALEDGPLTESHAVLPRRVNTGLMQIVDRYSVRLRVYECGAGETLACGTGACAAMVVDIHRGLLDSLVKVATHSGDLTTAQAGDGQPVMMTGPATTVFGGTLDLDALELTAAYQARGSCPFTCLSNKETP